MPVTTVAKNASTEISSQDQNKKIGPIFTPSHFETKPSVYSKKPSKVAPMVGIGRKRFGNKFKVFGIKML